MRGTSPCSPGLCALGNLPWKVCSVLVLSAWSNALTSMGQHETAHRTTEYKEVGQWCTECCQASDLLVASSLINHQYPLRTQQLQLTTGYMP